MKCPTLVRGLSDADAMAGALVENLQREDLNAIEEAEGIPATGHGVSGCKQDRLARAVGKSRSHIANTCRLLTFLPGAGGSPQRQPLSRSRPCFARCIRNRKKPPWR